MGLKVFTVVTLMHEMCEVRLMRRLRVVGGTGHCRQLEGRVEEAVRLWLWRNVMAAVETRSGYVVQAFPLILRNPMWGFKLLLLVKAVEAIERSDRIVLDSVATFHGKSDI